MNHKTLLRFTLIALLLLIVHGLQAVTAIQVGASQANQTISAAITAAGDITGTGGLIIELQSDYAPVDETIEAITGASASDPVTIRPAAVLSLSSVAWTINGSYITIDGRVGSTGSTKALTLSNTSTSGVSLTISGNNNTVKYVTLQGMNTSNAKGVIVFNASTGNVIDYCDVCDVPATGTPTIGIYSASASTNTISNSNIFNYYSSTETSRQCGIYLGAGTTGWTITGNSFYNTKSTVRTFTAGAAYSAVYVDNTSNSSAFTISNNYIGGQGPQCSVGNDLCGTSTTTTGSGPKPKLIYLNTNNGYSNTVSGNTIKSIAIGSSSAYKTNGSAIANQHGCIVVNAGSNQISNNLIGNDASSITYEFSQTTSTWNLYLSHIAIGGSGTNTIQNNTIGGIKTSATTATVGTINLWGIYNESTGSTTISNNVIGSTATGITDGTQMSIQNVTTGSGGGTKSTAAKAIYNNTSGSVTISNNTIANIYGCNGSQNQLFGIGCNGTGTYSITGNTIRDLINSSTGSTTWPNGGIFFTATSAASSNTISGNTIYNMKSTTTGVTLGIAVNSTSGAQIYNNLIYNIHSTNLGYGIQIATNASTNTVYNNIIRLGYDISNEQLNDAITLRGISDESGSSTYYFNTIYIGAAPTTGTTATYAFYSSATPATARNIENNIFQNATTNNGATAKHYAIRLGNITNTTCDYNDLVSESGYIGNWNGTDKATLTDWQGAASGLDANSKNVTPTFHAVLAITPDLHIYTGGGFAISSLAGTNTVSTTPNTDIDGDARVNYTMGADDNGVSVDVSTSNSVPSLKNSTVSVINHQLIIQSNRDISKVLIYDFNGKTVKNVSSGFNNISLNNGAYVVKIVNSQSSDIYKIMVK